MRRKYLDQTRQYGVTKLNIVFCFAGKFAGKPFKNTF
jgi:hypothetical protein